MGRHWLYSCSCENSQADCGQLTDSVIPIFKPLLRLRKQLFSFQNHVIRIITHAYVLTPFFKILGQRSYGARQSLSPSPYFSSVCSTKNPILNNLSPLGPAIVSLCRPTSSTASTYLIWTSSVSSHVHASSISTPLLQLAQAMQPSTPTQYGTFYTPFNGIRTTAISSVFLNTRASLPYTIAVLTLFIPALFKFFNHLRTFLYSISFLLTFLEICIPH